jgi:hypothetical protein
MTNVSRILRAGEPHLAEQLPLVYDELRRRTVAKLDNEKSGQTLGESPGVNLMELPRV